MEVIKPTKVETTYRHKETGELFKERKDWEAKGYKEEDMAQDVNVVMPSLDLFGETKQNSTMAITRAQQAKQMLQDGGRIGFQGGGADAGGKKSPGKGTFKSPAPQSTYREEVEDEIFTPGPGGGDDRKEVRDDLTTFPPGGDDTQKTTDIPKVPPKKPKKTKDNTLPTLNTAERFRVYNLKKLYERKMGLEQPVYGVIPNLLQAVEPTELSFYEESDPMFDASYYGMTGKEITDADRLAKAINEAEKTGNITQTQYEDAFFGPSGPPEVPSGNRDDGPMPMDPCLGPNPPAYCFIGKKADETQEAAVTRNLAGLTPRIGGSIFDFTGMADGGLADLARQELFLGGIVKGVKKGLKGITRGIKKVAKSPLGKLALLAAGGSFALGLGPFAAGSTMFGGKLAGLKGAGFLKSAGLKNFFLKEGAEKFALSNLSGKGIASLIGGASLLPLLMGTKEEDEFDIDAYYAANRLNPNAPLNRRIAGSEFSFADGGRIEYDEAGAVMSKEDMEKLAKSPLYKGFKKMYGVDPEMAKGNESYKDKFKQFEQLFKKGYQEGGDVEPVAKKTMPLLDMGGQEMDLRAKGGFVPIGRMEKADDVPARLSKNEFVFTAEAVRNAGDGDVDKGAEVMYNMMKNLEAGGEVSEESQGLEGAREMFKTSQRLGEVL